MKITYAPNPLRTKVELDDHDKAILRLKIKVEFLEERIAEAHFDLDPQHREFNAKHIGVRSLDECIAAAMAHLHPTYERDGAVGPTLDERIEKQLGWCTEALLDEHGGDCTCVACSCRKCHAEELLGIDTIAGLGKHPGHAIYGAFFTGKDQPERTIDEAIEYLRTYSVEKTGVWEKYDEAYWATLTERWAGDRKRAHDWLMAYRDAHFPKEPCT